MAVGGAATGVCGTTVTVGSASPANVTLLDFGAAARVGAADRRGLDDDGFFELVAGVDEVAADGFGGTACPATQSAGTIKNPSRLTTF